MQTRSSVCHVLFFFFFCVVERFTELASLTVGGTLKFGTNGGEGFESPCTMVGMQGCLMYEMNWRHLPTMLKSSLEASKLV